ncbi:sugar kinase [Bifidobacterium sp. ESL0763]|uniref:sugar kinase n=1 Tax=Bifidobacterium sp. ESL0763 TaxID=2983227 RepID=UPI0023F6D956|nr:sugar kinase [Bifidobacterium sp. ESL0763]MDF7664267.1 sugar kinase [Bifidobacterium sp. ESL0763]
MEQQDFHITGIGAGKVMLVGEAMALYTAEERGSLGQVRSFAASVAGAELNVAIGLKRMGAEAAFMTRLGRDPYADRILGFMERNHVDTHLVTRDSSHPTGSMLKSKYDGDDPKTFYFRKGSPASRITCDDVERLDFQGMGILHLTGIFPALSSSALEASRMLVRKARQSNVFISFDPNLRPSLWPDDRTMCEVTREFCSQADLVLPGVHEGERLFGVKSVEDMGQAFIDNGAGYAIVKDGARGCYGTDGGHGLYVPGFVLDHVVDTVGSGDGFAAGVLSSLLEGASAGRAMERGCAIGAMQTQSISDNEGLPTPRELAEFTGTHRRCAR